MFKVAIVVVPEAFPHSIIEPFVLFNHSNKIYRSRTGENADTPVSVSIVAESKDQVFDSNGIRISPSEDVRTREAFDLIWIPSLMIGSTDSYRKRKPMISWIKNQIGMGAKVATVCTGAFLLAETGLLNFKHTTLHWSFAERFADTYPLVTVNPEIPISSDGAFYSAAADNEWLTLAKEVLTNQFGKDISVKTAEMFSFSGLRPMQTSKVSETAPGENHDAVAEKARAWLSAHISEENLISRAATEVGMSESSMARRFKTAYRVSLIGYIQEVRIERAKDALEMSSLPIERISEQIGYRDSSYFRRLFKVKTGMTPKEYRKSYGS
ncbi:MAG: hypothetical protein CMK89_08945 [Pseudomonadales bacterium]|nr:hypothetical protein [Pseudomonadales bacterium]